MSVSSTVRGKVIRAMVWKEVREVTPGVLLLGGVGFAAAASAPWWDDNVGAQDRLAPLLAVLIGGLAVFYFALRAAAGHAARPTLLALPVRRWLQRALPVLIGMTAALAVVVLTAMGGFTETNAGMESVYPSTLIHTAERSIWWVPLLGVAVAFLWVHALVGSASSLTAGTWRIAIGLIVYWTLTWLINGPMDRLLRSYGMWNGRDFLRSFGIGFGPAGGLSAADAGPAQWLGVVSLLLVAGAWILLRPVTGVLLPLLKTASHWLRVRSQLPDRFTARWNRAGLLLGALALPACAIGFLLLNLLAAQPRSLNEIGLSPMILFGVVIQAALLPLALFGRELDGDRPWFWRSLPLGGARWFTARFASGVGLAAAGWTTGLLLSTLGRMWMNFRPEFGPPDPVGWFRWVFGHPMVAATAISASAVFALGVIGTAWSRRPLESGVVALALVVTGSLLLGFDGEMLTAMERWFPTAESPHPPPQSGRWLAAAAALALAWGLGAWSFHRRVA